MEAQHGRLAIPTIRSTCRNPSSAGDSRGTEPFECPPHDASPPPSSALAFAAPPAAADPGTITWGKQGEVLSLNPQVTGDGTSWTCSTSSTRRC
jgi:hypothetical protein